MNRVAKMLTLWMTLTGAVLASPVADRALEKVIYTSGQEVSAIGIGQFLSTQSGLSLINAGAVRRTSYWLPATEDGWVQDGLVRARFVLGSRPDFTLLTRAEVPEGQPEDLSALGLSVTSKGIELYRYHRGVAQPIAPQVRVKGLKSGRKIEVVLLLAGPYITAQLYDPDSLRLLATTSAYDSAQLSGSTGLRTYRKSDMATRLTHLAVAQSDPEGDLGTSLPGNERLVEVRADQRRIVDKMKTGRVVRKATVDGVERFWWLTDRLGLERLYRAEISPLSVTDAVPFWTRDARYLGQMGKPPTATDTGFRLDLSYKDADMVDALVRGYHEKYPNITALHVIGTTHLGREILALRITDNPTEEEGEPSVLLNAAHHGGELLSTEYALDAMRTLLESYAGSTRVQGWVNSLDIWLIPLVNPDSNWRYMRVSKHCDRKNARDNNGDGELEIWEGVDLNRNYPFRWGTGEVPSRGWHRSAYYRGPSAGSEPETQAMMKLANERHFVASISWHTSATKVLTPYTIDRVENIKPDIPRSFIQPIVDQLPTQPNDKDFTVARKLYSVDGVDQDWFFHTHGTLAYLLEGSHHNPGWTMALASIKGARPFYQLFLDRLVKGPMIVGRVVNLLGKPREAVVTIDEIQTFNDEKWTSRPSDGRFARAVTRAGTYTVRATYGQKTASKTVQVGADGWAEVKLVLR